MRLLLTASASLLALTACAPETTETEEAPETAAGEMTDTAENSGTEQAEDAYESEDSNEAASYDTAWGYEGEIAAANWGSLSEAWEVCSAGLEQSPIDLIPGDGSMWDEPVLNWQTSSGATVVDNGHTIQVNLDDAGTMTIGDRTYNLVQFHFHAGSEHTVEGEQFPLEVHFVHASNEGALAVVGVFFEEGDAEPALDPIWSSLPDAVGETETDLAINPYDFLPEIGRGAWRYSGSLTTPPCSEGVNWSVIGTPISLSPEQLAGFTARYDNNYRPVQPLNEREVGSARVQAGE